MVCEVKKLNVLILCNFMMWNINECRKSDNSRKEVLTIIWRIWSSDVVENLISLRFQMLSWALCWLLETTMQTYGLLLMTRIEIDSWPIRSEKQQSYFQSTNEKADVYFKIIIRNLSSPKRKSKVQSPDIYVLIVLLRKFKK